MPNTPLSGEFILSQDNPEKNTAVSQPLPKASPVTLPSEQQVPNLHNHVHTTPRFWSSLMHYPSGVRFLDQEVDEEVVLVVRQDFITNFPWTAAIIVLAFVPPFLFLAVPYFLPFISFSQALITISVIFYYLILSTFTLLYFAIWYFNVGIVTNKRVLDIDVPNILVTVISEVRLASIVDVTVTQVGGIRSIFNYGDIEIQTEGIHQNIEFSRAPEPNLIRKIIGELIVGKPEA